jgi:predicted nuclease with RNAse H fold
VSYPTFLGIDLASTAAKSSACVGLDNESQLVYLGFLAKNTDIIALVDLYSPRTIAVDAPLSSQLGLCLLEEGCPCKPESPRKNRQCDLELRQQGIPCYSTSKETFIKNLIYRGIELKTSLGRDLKQAGQGIEVYPFASKVRLLDPTVPRRVPNKG